jgi:hypothetical protein
MSQEELLLALAHSTSMETPGAIRRSATVRDVVRHTRTLSMTLYSGRPINLLLQDPDNRTFLDMPLGDAGLLQATVLRLFQKPDSLIAFVSRNGQVEYYVLPSSYNGRGPKNGPRL